MHNMDDATKDTINQTRSACTECQRRKQKCNREWPCNHCQKRKVADKCRFNAPVTTLDKPPPESKKNGHHPALIAQHDGGRRERQNEAIRPPQGQASLRKRQLERHDDDSEADQGADDDDDDDLGLSNIGYMASHQFASLGINAVKEKQASGLFMVKASANPHLERALQTLPKRPHMDAMVQNFFDNVNYHYYIIYPPVFLQEYKEWWIHRNQGWVLSLQWTCLLLTVCSCACQHLPVDVQEKLEQETGETASQLSERYHDMARELGNAMPVGYYHMYNVQWLLHSTYWFKAEARFLECWHVLGAAAREAQELGFHKREAAEHLPEFEREMRRRVWCVIDCWDWQISSGLFRPTIIDHTDCTVELPTLTLEDFSPSPLMHMKLQSELIHQLAARFGAPKNINSTQNVRDYKKIIDDWMERFPPAYALEDPDISGDKDRPWIRFHRHYIHTMGYMMLLNPIRSFMAMTITHASPPDELAIRAIGVDYALRAMDVLRDWVDFVSYRDGRFHFIIFALFDTSAVLSTALIKDEAGTIPCRNEIYNMIDSAVVMLKELMTLSPTAKMSYDILFRIVRKVPRPAGFRRSGPRQRYGGIGAARVHTAASASPFSPPNADGKRHQTYRESLPISRIKVPVQPTLPPSPSGSTGVYVPVQPPLPASMPPMPMQSGVHVPVQPLIYTPQGVHVPIQIPFQPSPTLLPLGPPPPSGLHDLALNYMSQSASPCESAYMSPPYAYDASPPPPPQLQAPSPGNGAPVDVISSTEVHALNGQSLHASGSPHLDMIAMGVTSGFDAHGASSHGTFEISSADRPVEEQFDRITDAELGALATLWNWQSLNLPFISSETAG